MNFIGGKSGRSLAHTVHAKRLSPLNRTDPGAAKRPLPCNKTAPPGLVLLLSYIANT